MTVEVLKEMLRPRNATAKILLRRQPVMGLAFVCAGAIILAACSSVLSEMPTQVGGLPAGAPQRPAVAPEFEYHLNVVPIST